MTSTIEVFVGDRHVGDAVVEVRRGHQGASMGFTYRDDWIAFEHGFAISPDLPLRRGPQLPATHRETFVAFDDAAPDSWGRALLRAQLRDDARARGERFAPPTEIDLLLRVPDRTRQGALRFRVDGEFVGAAATTTGGIDDLASLASAAARFEASGEIDESVRSLIALGSTPGGARPKAWVHDPGSGFLLAKFPAGDDRGDVGAWEHATARMMRDAGIRTSSSATIRLAPSRSIFLTPRFDREDATERRLPYMSVRSVMRLAAGDRPDYVAIGQAVAQQCADPRRARHEIFERAAFSALVRNHDDHMRNHGLLRSGHAWALSPAFDVNPGRFAGEGTPLVPGGDPLDRDVRELVEHAADFSLTREVAERRLRELAGVTGRWREYAVAAGVEPDAVEALAGAFEGPNLERALSM